MLTYINTHTFAVKNSDQKDKVVFPYLLQTPTHMHPQTPVKKHELMTKKER
jgi:hypothetical protein